MPALPVPQAAAAGRLRHALLADCDVAASRGNAARRNSAAGQAMFDLGEAEAEALPPPPDPPGDRDAVRLLMGWEKEALGFYLSFHPCLTAAGEALARLAPYGLKDLAAASPGASAWVCGVADAKPFVSKSGNAYARGSVSTPAGDADCTFFGEAAADALAAAFDEPLALLLSATADPNAVTCERVLRHADALLALPAAAAVRRPPGPLSPLFEHARGLGGKGCAVFLEDAAGRHYRLSDARHGPAELATARAAEFAARVESAYGTGTCPLFGRKRPLPPRKYDAEFVQRDSQAN